MKLIVLLCLLFSSVGGFCEDFSLHLHEKEKVVIREIFTEMAERDVTRLFTLDAMRLWRLRKHIDHVPPLELVAYMVTDPQLKASLKKISRSFPKWSIFLRNFGNNMEREMMEGRLFEHLPGFAEMVDEDLWRLENYARLQDWDGFVRCIL